MKTAIETRYFKIGAFILVGLGLFVIGLLAFGSKQLLEPTIYFETYFDESVQGIAEGSAVKYRGLQIGYIKNISFVNEVYDNLNDAKLHNRSIYAKIAVTSKLFTQLSAKQLKNFLDTEIASGLRIKIETQGLTGIAYLELNYTNPKNNPIPPLTWTPKYHYVPSTPSMMTELGKNVQYILHEIKDVDFKKIFTDLATLTDTANKLLKRTDNSLSKINEPLENTLWNLKALSEDLQTLVAQLKLQPSQLLFGNPPAPLNPEKL